MLQALKFLNYHLTRFCSLLDENRVLLQRKKLTATLASTDDLGDWLEKIGPHAPSHPALKHLRVAGLSVLHALTVLESGSVSIPLVPLIEFAPYKLRQETQAPELVVTDESEGLFDEKSEDTSEIFLCLVSATGADVVIKISTLDGSVCVLNAGVLSSADYPSCSDGQGLHWFLDSARHRSSGPAIEFRSGAVEYWLDGVQVDENGHELAFEDDPETEGEEEDSGDEEEVSEEIKEIVEAA